MKSLVFYSLCIIAGMIVGIFLEEFVLSEVRALLGIF